MTRSNRKPNFLYLGPPKSGSTWLYEVLRWHPQVFIPPAKELFFFDNYYHLGEEWYLALFKDATPAHAVVGEMSPNYLFSVQAADRIRDHLPGVKLMACLREPVELAFSIYLFMRKQGRIRCSFDEAIQTVDELVDHHLYATLLRPYYERFGPEAVYTPLFDDLKADSNAFAQQVFSFLGVEQLPLPLHLVQPVNEAQAPRSLALGKLAWRIGGVTRRLGRPELVMRAKSSGLVRKTLYRDYGKGRKPTLDAATRERLKVLFREDVYALSELIGVDVAARWGYRDGGDDGVALAREWSIGIGNGSPFARQEDWAEGRAPGAADR